MTTSDALYILHVSTLNDLTPCTVVRYADETDSDVDRDEVNAAAVLLGFSVEEDEDGNWVIVARASRDEG